jgi:hypothetical protein
MADIENSPGMRRRPLGPSMALSSFSKKRGSILPRKTWLFYFFLASLLFGGLVSETKKHSFLSLIKDDPMFFVAFFFGAFALFCGIAASPDMVNEETLLERSSKASIAMHIFLDFIVLLLSTYLMFFPAYSTPVLVVFPLVQRVVLLKHLTPYLAKMASKTPFVVRAAVISSLARYRFFRLIILLYNFVSSAFMILMSFLLYLCVIPSHILDEPYYFLVTFFFSLWVYYAGVIFQRMYITSLVYLTFSSASNNVSGRNAFSALRDTLEQAGSILFMGLVLLLFSLLDGIKALLFYELWPMSLKRMSSRAVSTLAPVQYQIYKNGLCVLSPFVSIFRVSLGEASVHAREFSVDMERDLEASFRSRDVQRVSAVFPTFMLLFIVLPMMLLTSLDCTIAVVTWIKMGVVLLWGSIEFTSFLQISSDAIHKALIIFSTGDMYIENAITENYSYNLMGI